jgi:pimeloyl-ACP methyl ester carboxylesterase
MKRTAVVIAGLIVAAALSPAQSIANGFNGLNVSLATYLPSIAPANVLGSGTATVIPGVVTFANLADPPYAHTSLPSGVRLVNQNFYVDGIVITEKFDVSEEGTAFFSGVPFAGEVLSILTPNAPAITGVSVLPSTNAIGFTSDNVSFTSTTVAINHSGASLPTNAPGVIQIAVTFGHASAVTLVDPVPDLVNALSTANTTLLGDPSHGRVVQGVAADGVARVVVRIPASTEGENITVSVINDTGNPSQSVNDDGGVASLDNPTSFGQSASAQAASVGGTSMAFVVYRAPIDFPRSSGEDSQAAKRFVNLQIVSSVSNQSLAVIVVRPPVAFVHGVWGDDATWTDFGYVTSSPGLLTTFASYSGTVQVLDTDPVYLVLPSLTPVSSVNQNALGYRYNAQVVLDEVQNLIDFYSDAEFVSAVQADLVVHSMGGLITRTMPLLDGYASPLNYNLGLVHKLITIDSPHLGTPVAAELLDPSNSCIQGALYHLGNLMSLTQVHLAEGSAVDGAVLDLEGDGYGNALSEALKALNPADAINTVTIPTVFISGNMDINNLLGLDESPSTSILRRFCDTSPLAAYLSPEAWSLLLGDDSDAIVPLSSQDLSGQFRHVLGGVVHSAGTEKLGFSPPDVLSAGVGTPAWVLDMLNTPVTSNTFYPMLTKIMLP